MSVAALVADEVRALEGSGLEALRVEWRRRYGQPPPLRSADLLARLLTWRIQAEVMGGLDAPLKARLKRKGAPALGPALLPGMRLEREWRGTTEVVDVLDGGFQWREQTFRSLTQVATAMTGTKWNGPRFFGLRGSK